MEEELKCPACRQFLRDPLLLQCAHSYCRDCALAAQVKITSSNALSVNNMTSGINPTSNYANFSPLSPPCSSNSGASMSSDTISLCVSDADQESFDKMSVVSETDSGVVICGIGSGPGSRPNSFLSSGGGISPTVPPQRSVPSILSSPNPTSTAHHAGCYVLICEACHKPTYLADNTVLKNARENLAIRRLLAKYKASKGEAAAKNIPALSNCNQTEVPNCQWCESQQPSRAELFCVECGYYYCPACQPVIHPARGPLKDHKLVTASNAAAASSNNHTLGRRMSICSTTASTSNLWKASTIELADNSQDGSESSSQTCEVHSAEPLSMYCVICRVAVCCQCLMSRHASHQVQSLSTAAKTQKAELSQTLQLLSEKARQASEEIGRLRQFQERITTNYNEFASVLDNQFEALLEELKNQRQKLLDFVEAERLRKKAIMKSQIGRCAGHLGKTTALIQFCIEVLKEPEPLAYIQVGNALATRVVNQEFLWHREMRTKPETDAEFVYTLDTEPLEMAIRALDFVQLKVNIRRGVTRANESEDFPTEAPPRPCFEPSACSAENNSVVVVWNCPQVSPSTIPIDGYSLEIDSGRDHGMFKEVYSGPDNVCTIDGLHFDTLYNARVKAFNSAGESEYSDPICLQTAQYACFHLVTDSNTPANNEFILSNDGISVVGTTAEYRTVLGSVSFARGVHYWEVSVDQYKGNSDVVLGVAQLAANRSLMLGKDIYGWSMYVDRERSWFFHNDSHHGRLSGGLDGEGTVIGVLMDCDRGILTFYLNDAPLSDCAFRNMPRGHYIPAFSVNRNSRISVHSGMGPPPSVLTHIREAVQDRL